MVENTAIQRVGDLLAGKLDGLNVAIKFRPGPNYTIVLPHIVYDVSYINSPGADNKRWLHFYQFNVIYETKTPNDEAFLRLLDMPELRYISCIQMPGYTRYTFKTTHL